MQSPRNGLEQNRRDERQRVLTGHVSVATARVAGTALATLATLTSLTTLATEATLATTVATLTALAALTTAVATLATLASLGAVTGNVTGLSALETDSQQSGFEYLVHVMQYTL